MKLSRHLLEKLMVRPGRRVRLNDYRSDWTGGLEKDQARELLGKGVERLRLQQEMLYADDRYAVLLIFQAMDAAGKDGTIKHVMSGINPQGCQVFSFKAPSAEERDHGYLWRTYKALPERGRIGIHNRSYYEEVLVARVHPEILASQQLPDKHKTRRIWRDRFRQINAFERYLVENGTIPIKFFLNVSKKEQKRRFLERLDRPEKNWKFSVNDAKERGFWNDYMTAYEDVLRETSTEDAPWYVIPADNKWFTRFAVAEIVGQRMKNLKLRFPRVSDTHRRDLLKARRLLMNEKR